MPNSSRHRAMRNADVYRNYKVWCDSPLKELARCEGEFSKGFRSMVALLKVSSGPSVFNKQGAELYFYAYKGSKSRVLFPSERAV